MDLALEDEFTGKEYLPGKKIEIYKGVGVRGVRIFVGFGTIVNKSGEEYYMVEFPTGDRVRIHNTLLQTATGG